MKSQGRLVAATFKQSADDLFSFETGLIIGRISKAGFQILGIDDLFDCPFGVCGERYRYEGFSVERLWGEPQRAPFFQATPRPSINILFRGELDGAQRSVLVGIFEQAKVNK